MNRQKTASKLYRCFLTNKKSQSSRLFKVLIFKFFLNNIMKWLQLFMKENIFSDYFEKVHFAAICKRVASFPPLTLQPLIIKRAPPYRISCLEQWLGKKNPHALHKVATQLLTSDQVLAKCIPQKTLKNFSKVTKFGRQKQSETLNAIFANRTMDFSFYVLITDTSVQNKIIRFISIFFKTFLSRRH